MPNEKTINRYVLERARLARLAHGGGIMALRRSCVSCTGSSCLTLFKWLRHLRQKR